MPASKRKTPARGRSKTPTRKSPTKKTGSNVKSRPSQSKAKVATENDKEIFLIGEVARAHQHQASVYSIFVIYLLIGLTMVTFMYLKGSYANRALAYETRLSKFDELLIFKSLDTNNDGKIDANDLRAFYLATDIDDHSLAVR